MSTAAIHLVCQDVNLGMPPAEFCELNREVQRARSLVDAGLLTCSCLSLAFCTTVICLSARALPALAEAMQEAAEVIGASLEPGQALQRVKPIEEGEVLRFAALRLPFAYPVQEVELAGQVELPSTTSGPSRTCT